MEGTKKSFWQKYNPFGSKATIEKPTVQANYNAGSFSILFSTSYTGEKNLGEAGPIKGYHPAYDSLRARAWDAYLTNEIVQIIINKFSTWVIGKGLKLQSEPVKIVLKSEGINLKAQDFCDSVEARFNLYAKTELCDYSGMKNLGMLETTAYKNAKIGGDVLVILRYIDGFVRIQLVDGAHVRSPLGYGTDIMPQLLSNGNRIMNGIEMNERGEHIAYYIWTYDTTQPAKWERVECKGKKSNMRMAYMVSGLEYRIDNARCIPAISTTLETLAKLDRYKEATLGAAEENAKINYTVEHQQFSSGENPMLEQIVKANGFGGNTDIPVTNDGEVVANKVRVSTNKEAWNMPIGSSLKTHESKKETHFKDFYSVNFDLICAAFGAPPEVMASKYDSTFSSARAAIKDWEHTLHVERAKFAFEFHKPIFNFWLEMEILNFKIQAPGYLQAKLKGDEMVLAAYRNARFVGPNVPHIDPLKEVTAERLKLGDTGSGIPLTTAEAATENLNGGEFRSNMEQYSEELQSSKDLGIETIVVIADPKKKKTEPSKNN